MTESLFPPKPKGRTGDFNDKITLFAECIPDDKAKYDKNKEYEIEIFKNFKFNVVHYTSSDSNIAKLKDKYKDEYADTIVSKTKFNQQNILVFIQKRNISYFEYETSMESS